MKNIFQECIWQKDCTVLFIFSSCAVYLGFISELWSDNSQYYKAGNSQSEVQEKDCWYRQDDLLTLCLVVHLKLNDSADFETAMLFTVLRLCFICTVSSCNQYSFLFESYEYFKTMNIFYFSEWMALNSSESELGSASQFGVRDDICGGIILFRIIIACEFDSLSFESQKTFLDT